MAWTTPKTFVSLDVLTAAELNTHLRDNLQYLYDLPKLTAARAHMTSDKNITGSGVWTQIDTFTEDYDYGNAFASNAYTVPSTGLYDIKAQINVTQANNPQTLVLGIFKDGVEHLHGTDDTRDGIISGDAATLHYADQVEFVAGAVLTVRIYNTQANTCVAKGTNPASSFFAIRRVC